MFQRSRTISRLNVLQRLFHDLVKSGPSGKTFTRQGPGGRSSVSGHTATVFGATGFLGRYVVNNLAKQGTQVVTPYRGPDDEKRHLKLMGDLGQINFLKFDLRNEQQIRECVRHSDIVYNLIGRDFETKNFKYNDVHVTGAALLARLCKEEGVNKFVHVSSLNADPDSKSLYLKSKALGEQAVLAEFPSAIIVRPAYMYGNEDRFWNRLGFYAKFSPIGLPVPRPKTLIRPVYVGDVANVLARLMHQDSEPGRIIELYGLVASIFDRITATPFITADEIERLCIDDVVHPGALKFSDFNVDPYTVEETISRYVRLFQSEEHQMSPLEPAIKKYSTDHVKM